MLNKLCYIIVILGFSTSFATMHIQGHCPEVVEGKVIEVKELDEVDHMMAKVEVSLENFDGEIKKFKYPKYALTEIEKDQEYAVGLRNQKVCLVERI